MFVESYECETKVKNGMINSVECEEKSTYKIGSRGTKGVQAIVEQKLVFVSSSAAINRMNYGPFSDVQDITFEFSDKSVDDLEYKNVDPKKFIMDLCNRLKGKDGLDDEHANTFRAVVNKLEGQSEEELLRFYDESKARCALGG